MTDIKRNGLFNQKRSVCVGVFKPTEAEILAVAQVAVLPERSIVTKVFTNVITASSTALSNLTVRVGGTSIATNVAVATAGLKSTSVPGYFPTGGELTVIVGSTPPAAGDLEVEVIVEYIELDKTTGEYTAY